MRLLIWAYLLVLLSASTGAGTESSPQSISESMPVVIHYSHGACHAEWGRTDVWMDGDGSGLYESGSGELVFFEDEERFEREEFRKTFILNETELKDLLHELKESGFYSLNDSYYNPEVRDGSCEDISITVNGSTKTVGVSNTDAPRAYEIAAELIEGMAENKNLVVPYSARTFESLIWDLNDSDRDVRAGAAFALRGYKDARAVDPLIRALQ
ncbi:MAG: hypothetical protein PHQ34_14425, partial [Methanothrix sp.]|nr:hypothetical protein [Methanothrix sp.]